MRGRKKLPTATKRKKGTLENRRVLKDEMEAPTVARIPAAPSWLNKHGKAEFLKVARELKALGLLATIDTAALAIYANEFGLYVECQVKLKQKDNDRYHVYKTSEGEIKHTQTSGLQKIADKALENALKFATQFGFTPSSRTSIGTSHTKGRGSKTATLMEQGKKQTA